MHYYTDGKKITVKSYELSKEAQKAEGLKPIDLEEYNTQVEKLLLTSNKG